LISGLGALADSGAIGFAVLDGLDQVLSNLPDVTRRRSEMYRILAALSERGVTSIITTKGEDDGSITSRDDSFMQFATQCVISLRRRTSTGAMVRSLQILKYRGSSFGGTELPYVIDDEGVVPALVGRSSLEHSLSRERISTGVADLDAVLEGGYLRGSVTMISGAPGTAKTTLAACAAQLAAENGQRALYIAFDESFEQIVLDMHSLGLELDRAQGSDTAPGMVRGMSLSALGITAEEHYIRVRRTIESYQPEVVVIDPVSALFKGYDSPLTRGVAERLVDMLKSSGITTILTSLVEPNSGVTASSISTLADTWISLSYTIAGNSRGRALRIVKSRGTHHTHNILELRLSRKGVSVREPDAVVHQQPLNDS